MAEYRRAEITSGLFIVLSVLVFALFAFKIGGLNLDGWFGPSGARFYAYFDEVRELGSKSPVKVGGNRVGTVESVEMVALPFEAAEVSRLEENAYSPLAAGIKAGRLRYRQKVTFIVEDDSVRLAPDASVKIEQQGFIGPFFVNLDCGTWGEGGAPPAIKDAPARTTPVPSRPTAGLIDDFRERFGPTIKHVDGILQKLNEDLFNEASKGDLQRIIPLLAADLDDARALLGRFDDLLDPANADGVQQTVLRPTSRLLTRLDGSAIRLEDLLKEAAPEVRRLMESANGAAAEGERTIATLRRLMSDGEPKIRAMLNDVELLTHALAAKSGDLQKMVDDAKAALGDAKGMLSDNRANLAEMMRTFRNAAWEMELAVRKVRANPAVVLFGDDENVLEAAPRDDSGLRKSGRAKPYEQRDEGEKEGGK